MPTTQTVRPDATVSNTGWTRSGGSTVHGVLADNVDINQMQNASSGLVVVDVGTYALQADERCQRVRVRARGQAFDSGWWQASVRSGTSDAGIVSFAGVGTMTTKTGGWVNNPPNNPTAEWLQADIDAVRATADSLPGASGAPFVVATELYIDLDIHKKPTVSISAPVYGSTTPTKSPTLTWTYVGDGDLQKKYHVKVFSQAVAEGGGFDVTTSPTVYDSGAVTSSAASAVLSGLDHGEAYYAFIKVAKDFNGADWDSAWSTGQFFRTNDQPVATITEPSGAITDTNRPAVGWTFVDTEGNPQTHVEAYIYEEPVGGWVGFDINAPGAETPVWTTGGSVAFTAQYFETSSFGTFTGKPGLENTTNFRVYLRARQSDPSTIWSEWDYSDFNTSFSPAPVPVLAMGTQGDHYLDLSLSEGAGGPPTADTVVVERSLDGGTTWAPFRYGNGLILSDTIDPATLPATITDQEVPLGSEVRYRASSITVDSGSEVYSATSAEVAGTATGKKIWLKDPSDHSLASSIPVQNTWLAMTRARNRVVLNPIGRDLPVVIRGEGVGKSFTMAYLVLQETKYDELMALLLSNRTLFLQMPKGNMYVEVSGDLDESPHLWDELRGEVDVWQVSVPYVEVDF